MLKRARVLNQSKEIVKNIQPFKRVSIPFPSRPKNISQGEGKFKER
jgi:hypothetical protein